MNSKMKKDTLIKMLLLNLSLSFGNIFVFAKPFLHLDITSGNALATALGVMIIVMTIIIFVYGNYRILFHEPPKPKKIILTDDSFTLNDCSREVNDYIKNNVQTYAQSLKIVLSQISRLEKKEASLKSTLQERFDVNEISYHKFTQAIDSVEAVMAQNIRSLLARINAFDEEEYERLLAERTASKVKSERQDKIIASWQAIYQEYMDYVEKAVEKNEEMLIRLDKLMLEITKLSDINTTSIDEMPAMQEIDALINNTKFYK